jgi:asparagine synthase (glutamine-hydrolysing)
LLEEYYQGNLKSAVRKLVRDLDGAYVLVASDGANTVVVRDPVGRSPAYFAEDDHRACFASEKKALWRAGLRNVKTLRAGKLAVFGAGEVKVEKAFSLRDISYTPKIESLSQALSGYKEMLYEAVEKGLSDLNQAGVLVSGGVDSCLVAKLVQEIAGERGIEVAYYSAGLAGSPDLNYAENFAQSLNLPLTVSRLDIDGVENHIPKVIQAVEERDFVQVEAGIGVFAAMERARQDGIKVIFSGQGPDELWGGYSWYPEVVKEEGYDGFLKREWEDLERGDIETLEREVKLAMSQGMEERFPYLDLGVVKLAMSVAPELKILSPEDRLGKCPHRELAKQLGVPSQNAERLKDAAQHGSGVHSMLDRIARRNDFTPDLIEDIGYSPESITKEKLGSSTRYGYQYSDKSLWLIPPHIQLYFDIIAYEAGLLNEAEREKISYFVKLMGR